MSMLDIGNNNVIARLLDGYTKIETAKVQQRLNATATQQMANDVPSKLTNNPQASAEHPAASTSHWGLLAALAVGAVVLVAVVVK